MADDGFGANVQFEDDGHSTPAQTPGGVVERDEDPSPPQRGNTGQLLEKAPPQLGLTSTEGHQRHVSISEPDDSQNDSGKQHHFGASTFSFESQLIISTASALGGSNNNYNASAASIVPALSGTHIMRDVSPAPSRDSRMLSSSQGDNGFGQSVNSTSASPSFAGAEYVSFRSGPTTAGAAAMSRRSASGAGGLTGSHSVSSMSGVFVRDAGGHDDDDDDGAPQRNALSGGSDGQLQHDSGNKMKTKILPQQMLNADELEDELNAELMHVAESRATRCELFKLNIQRVPQELRQFDWLTELYLAENKIAVLGDTIFVTMQKLEVLDLTENRLQIVPRSCFQLKSLKRLLLDHNRIYCIPDEIDPHPDPPFGLPQLVEVGLEWNNLAKFPTNLMKWAPRIEKMFLSENPGISQLPSPQYLDLYRGTCQTLIRLDNRPMLLAAAASSKVYQKESGVVELVWNKIYPDRVLDFLYLGSMRTAQCVEVYQDMDIGYVLTAARNLDVVLGPGMKHLTLPFDDLPGADIAHFFDSSFRFIDEAVAAKRGILIHCFAGLSRSVAMTMGFLMRKYRIGADDALALIRQSRPSAHPNDGFINRLREYGRELGITSEESAQVRVELEKANRDARAGL